MNAQRRALMCRALVACFTLACTAAFLDAQATTSIRGSVSDAGGAFIHSVKITLENIGTGAVRTALTDNTGSYQFPQITPGRYRIKAEAIGFKSVAQENLELPV